MQFSLAWWYAEVDDKREEHLLPTNSMVKDPFWVADIYSAGHDIPFFYGTKGLLLCLEMLA
jgi:hypothetical protein